MKLKLISLSLCLLSLCLLSLVPSAHAQTTPLGLSIDPPVFEAVIKPGKTITQVFTIQNLSDSPRTLVAKIIPFTAGTQDGYPQLHPELTPPWLSYFSLANTYISLDQPFNLRAKQTEQLVVNLSIPAQAPTADIYATLYISSEGNLQDQLNGPNLGLAIGANLLISTSFTGNPPANISIENFSPFVKDIILRFQDYYIVDNLSPIRFEAIAKNNGKHFTKTGGSIKILDVNNDIVSSSALTPLNLLAGGTRIIQASESAAPTYKPQLNHLGKYQALLEVKNDNGSAKAQLTLVVLPLKISLAVLILLFFYLFIVKTKKNIKMNY